VAWRSGNKFHSINEVTLYRAKVNSAFHPSGVSKSSTGLSGWG